MVTTRHTLPGGTPFASLVERARHGESTASLVDELLSQLSNEEKLSLLDGDVPFWDGMARMLTNGYNNDPFVMGELERLGVPGLRFTDGPRGVVLGRSTAFPVSMARGATWDTDLEERIGTAIGLEARAQGANFYGGVCINLPRHPAWGRIQETYSEDPLLLGEFGAALTRGVQHNAMAVAKHFALNSMENARFKVDVTADEAALHEVFLPHFRRVVEEGVSAVMTAYNSVNGEWAGQNEYLMEGVLRKLWNFEGVTVSDFILGLRDAAKSLGAGLDVEEPFQHQRDQHLAAALEDGRAEWAHVDRAARRILRTHLHHYASRTEAEPGAAVVFSDDHRALAREAAALSMVLLKNEPVEASPLLPLDESGLSTVAVIGRLADLPNTGDEGSSNVKSPEVVTPLAGLTESLPDVTFLHEPSDSPEAAAKAAAAADVAILVVGYTAEDEGENLSPAMMTDPGLTSTFPPIEDSPAGQQLMAMLAAPPAEGATPFGDMGEGGDRTSLRLRPIDAEIIRATVAANPRTIVAIVAAGAVITEEWREAVPAVLLTWYSGCEGGRALADVLLGGTDANGRLPYSIPVSEDDLPFFDADATAITYDKWFGQRLLDRTDTAAAFPLGYGLSYTSFELRDIALGPVEGETFDVTVTVANRGERDGRHVVQLYALPTDAGDDFPSRVLVGFAPVSLKSGAEERVTVTASTRPLQRWTDGGFELATAEATIEAAAFAGDPYAAAAVIALAR